MAGKQTIIGIVCGVIILVALIYVVQKQSGSDRPPEAVAGQTRTYICTKCGEKVDLSIKQFEALKFDEATGYRKCPKCGEMGLWVSIKCPHCGKIIPGPPATVEPDEQGRQVYNCPQCGKNTFEPPAR